MSGDNRISMIDSMTDREEGEGLIARALHGEETR